MRGVLVLVAVLVASPVAAQFVVIDPANLAQALIIAERTLREYEIQSKQLELVTTMSQPLAGMDRYTMAPIATTRHDPSRFAYGRALITALNSGDARGDVYRASMPPLPLLPADVDRLPPASRKAVRDQLAGIEVSDSVAQRSVTQTAAVSNFSSGAVATAIAALQGDVVSPNSALHYLTAILDKMAGGELIARRQDQSANQLLSSALEQLIVKGTRQRNTETAVMNLRLMLMSETPSSADGSAEALRTWRQP